MTFPKIDMADEMQLFSSRAESSQYKLSEHTLRFMLAYNISVSDIDYSMRHGVIIEERLSKDRGSSYLIFSNSNERYLHLICGEDSSGWVYVLFAYIPKMPIWKSPMLRVLAEDVPMNNNDDAVVGTCYFCSGNLVEITMGNYDYRKEGRLYTLKKVPANICQQCGEKYLLPETGRSIDLLIADTVSIDVEQSTIINYQPRELG